MAEKLHYLHMVLQSWRSKYAFFVADNNTRNPYGLIDLNQIYDVDIILASMILARATSVNQDLALINFNIDQCY